MGDMCGGLSVISDIPKTTVYELCKWINRTNEIIPNETIEKPPSAELKPNQKDTDTLPDYNTLDSIIHNHIEHYESSEEIINKDKNKETVNWVTQTIKKNEHKRKQAPIGLKVTSKAFGSGRRIPIAARYNL